MSPFSSGENVGRFISSCHSNLEGAERGLYLKEGWSEPGRHAERLQLFLEGSTSSARTDPLTNA